MVDGVMAALKMGTSDGRVAQLVGATSHTPGGCGFNPWLGPV